MCSGPWAARPSTTWARRIDRRPPGAAPGTEAVRRHPCRWTINSPNGWSGGRRRGRPFADGGLRPRFEEEARQVGRLEHPSIVPVYDLGELPDGRPFFVMKLVHGPTLAEALAARAMPAEGLPRWVGVFEQVCAAV